MHTHTHTRCTQGDYKPGCGQLSFGFIMWKQCPRSVSLWTMTWWSEVSEGRGFVPAERLLLMEDNKPSVRMERRTLKPPSFMLPCHLNCLARLTHWGSVTQARDNPAVMDMLTASASAAERLMVHRSLTDDKELKNPPLTSRWWNKLTSLYYTQSSLNAASCFCCWLGSSVSRAAWLAC